MTVQLLYHTPLYISDKAISQCWNKPCDPANPNLARMERVINKHKHASTAEHLVYSFAINDISRACLQELARHRMASPTVKSSRYTLGELKSEQPFISGCSTLDSLADVEWYTPDAYDRACKYLVMTTSEQTNIASILALDNLIEIMQNTNIANDQLKYCLPESYKTSLSWTINARSLQNFLSLRSAPSALWEIRDLANAIYNVLPDDHKFLFTEHLHKEL